MKLRPVTEIQKDFAQVHNKAMYVTVYSRCIPKVNTRTMSPIPQMQYTTVISIHRMVDNSLRENIYQITEESYCAAKESMEAALTRFKNEWDIEVEA